MNILFSFVIASESVSAVFMALMIYSMQLGS
jgi:hypothetical protein